MHSVFRKEIIQFLGSVTGYLAVVTFLAASGLFLWVFPGNYNIPENGYATLESFFQLAPWLYLFLIPAITMRLFAEEKKAGTIELLLTRPIGDFGLVTAKYLASMVLVAFSLLPALLWFHSVHRLGNPVGNIDAGATAGAFTGLFFLASVYVAIGILASALATGQITAFILGMLMSFLFFLGFDFISGSGIPYRLEKSLSWLSLNEHYLSLSRGVIDISDLVYFIGMTLLFMMITVMVLRRRSRDLKKSAKLALLYGVLILALLTISDSLRLRLDLTAEKRFTLSDLSKEMAASLDEPVTVELFLEGELPPGFRKLQQAVADKVRDLAAYSPVPVRLLISDPYEAVPANQREGFFADLADKGIRPTDLRQKTGKGTVTSLIFPGALISMGNKQKGVSFLKNTPGLNHEVNLNHSVEGIEYELVAALKQMMSDEKPELVFLQGHGEVNPYEVQDLGSSLSESFNISFAETGELKDKNKVPKILVIADPVTPFPEPDKYVIDQLIMQGSRVLWLIDPVEVSLDSLSNGFMTLAFPRDLNLNDQLFRYGIRLNADLVQDVMCAQILVNTSGTADRPEFTPQPWYYSPLLSPSSQHPVSRNLNLLYGEFVSSIDTVADPSQVKTSLLLSTSPYGRIVRTPAGVSLDAINKPPSRELFKNPLVPAGVLLEGKFGSVFANRMLTHLGISTDGIFTVSQDTRMMFFSDGGLISNKVRYRAGSQPETLPLGYDRVSGQTFGNKEFFVNAIHYLADDSGILQLRNTSVKLRLLDKVKLGEEKNKVAIFNTGLPIVFVLLFGVVYNFIRRRKYTVDKS